MKERKSRLSIGLRYALAGVLYSLKHERNFKIHVTVFILTMILGAFLKISINEWFAILIVSAVVMQAELLNSAIEKAIDYIKPEIHPKAKVIKDISAGAVLITAMIAFMIGLIIFVPKILLMIRSFSV